MQNTQKKHKVAIIGSGPSGFYTAEALLKSGQSIAIDIFDRLPTPFGLVRSGVAPDHPKIKSVTALFEKTLQNENVRFLGNVDIGTSVSVEVLKDFYHAIIFCYGAETDRRLDVKGEDLQGSYTATAFVGWYNGHPSYRNLEFDLSGKRAVIVGQGNVAVDVVRILAKTPDELRKTDITEHALEVLAENQIEEIVMIGRRGPVQARFTDKELRELGELSGCGALVLPEELELSEADRYELEEGKGKAQRNFELLRQFSTNQPHPKKNILLRFFRSPVVVEGISHVTGITLEKNILQGDAGAQRAVGTGELETLPCQIVFRSIGYRGLPLEGIPFDNHRSIIHNSKGRVIGEDEIPIPGLYTSGWIKRGPSGVIGTNKSCSAETVGCLLEDLPELPAPARNAEDIRYFLQDSGCHVVCHEDWQRIDSAEKERGKARGKPREKYTSVEEMLDLLRKND